MLQQLANLGSFIGGVGVLLTVVYLAIQIRQNTESNRAASYQAAVAAISEWSRQVGLDRSAARIVSAGTQDPGALGEEEAAQFRYLIVSLMRNFENIHYQYCSGAISPDAWEGWSHRILAFSNQPGVIQWWQEHETAYSSKFRELISSSKLRSVEKAEARSDA